nr:MAG TPA: hypothetical protein [Caudoviricetes sp.]
MNSYSFYYILRNKIIIFNNFYRSINCIRFIIY